MFKQALAASTVSAGILLAGAAMAQTRQPPMQQAPMNQAPMQAPMNRPMANGSSWNHGWNGREHAQRDSRLFTDALNTLYAHGFHGVHHLSMRHGNVVATAVTPNGRLRHVTVEPETQQIRLGMG